MRAIDQVQQLQARLPQFQERLSQYQGRLPQWLRSQLHIGDTLSTPAANDALAALERGSARANATLQRAARNAADTLRRSAGLQRSAAVGAGLGAMRVVRAHPALTAGLALGAIGIAVLVWRRRHAQQAEAQRPQPMSDYEPEYL